MSIFIITDACIGTVDQSCIEVCPVDCIYAVGEDADKPGEPYMMVIDPGECIECGACEPECPVDAIHQEEDVPDSQAEYTKINAMHNERGDNDGPDEDGAMDKDDIAQAAREAHDKLAA